MYWSTWFELRMNCLACWLTGRRLAKYWRVFNQASGAQHPASPTKPTKPTKPI
jgi:hypothetical protein